MMEKSTWKTLAIIFFIIALLETAVWVWALVEVGADEKATKECYYDICKDNVNAIYDLGVCTCYNINNETYLYEIDKVEVIR